MPIFSDNVGVVFGLEKCAVLVLKRQKMVQTEKIELSDGYYHHELRNKGKSEKRIHQKSKKVTQITNEWGKCYSGNKCTCSGYY